MKELSIEEKAKAYDEALKVLHKYDGANIMFSQSLKEEMFPELNESENDRIRKDIITYLSTVEDKAKHYDEAIERARDVYTYYCEDREQLRKIEHIFPELKESEDEKIRKALISILKSDFEKDTTIYDISVGDIITWLEKQGEQDPADTNKFIRIRETKPKDLSEFLDRLTIVEQEFLWEHIAKIRKLDKEEQKSTDKVEPKFNVGDTVKDPYGDVYHITEITNDSYKTADGRFILFENQEVYTLSNFTAWSEEDERIYQSIMDDTVQENQLDGKQIDWLRDIKYRYFLQPNDEWGEEDEMMIKFALTHFRMDGASEDSDIIKWLKSLKDRVQPKQEWIDKDILFHTIDNLKFLRNTISKDPKYSVNIIDIEREITWLKSLRPQNWTKEDKERYVSCLQRLSTGDPKQPETINSKWFKEHVYPQPTWKPSDEQMNTLEYYMHTLTCNEHKEILFGLYTDLKKLREE